MAHAQTLISMVSKQALICGPQVENRCIRPSTQQHLFFKQCNG